MFPNKLQLNYGDKVVTCELRNLEFYNEETERGQHYVHSQIEYMFDLEQYVDSEIQLVMCQDYELKAGQGQNEKDCNLSIWKHVDSNVSTELYHTYQKWIKENKQ